MYLQKILNVKISKIKSCQYIAKDRFRNWKTPNSDGFFCKIKKIQIIEKWREENQLLFFFQVRFITTRAINAKILQPIDMSDLAGVMERCAETDLDAHDNRVSFCVWHPKRCLLATR